MSAPLRVRQSRLYDSFDSPQLDPRRWQLVEMTDSRGRPAPYRDDNARVRTGDGQLEVTALPFTRFHDSEPVLNNAKHMYRSVERLSVPSGARIDFGVRMAARTYGQIPLDLQDAYVTSSLIDFDSGMVLLFAATNDTVYAVCERLPVPRSDSSGPPFRHRVVFDAPTAPGQEHDCAIRYVGDTGHAEWQLDGKTVFWAFTPVRVRGFHLGMGLLSSRDLERFSRSERQHGQGATGRWGPWRLSTAPL